MTPPTAPQTGPAEIQPASPLIAAPVTLPPPASAAPAAPAGEPDREPERQEQPAAPQEIEQPERPENVPDPTAQREHRERETLAALLASNDEYEAAINSLNRKVSQLGRNDLVLAAAVGVILWQMGALARKVFAAQVDAAIDTAGDLAGEV